MRLTASNTSTDIYKTGGNGCIKILQRNAIRERKRLEISANVFRRPFDSGDHRAVLGHLLTHVHCGYSPTSTPISNKQHSARHTVR